MVVDRQGRFFGLRTPDEPGHHRSLQPRSTEIAYSGYVIQNLRDTKKPRKTGAFFHFRRISVSA
jgi:hypothetical protein